MAIMGITGGDQSAGVSAHRSNYFVPNEDATIGELSAVLESGRRPENYGEFGSWANNGSYFDRSEALGDACTVLRDNALRTRNYELDHVKQEVSVLAARYLMRTRDHILKGAPDGAAWHRVNFHSALQLLRETGRFDQPVISTFVRGICEGLRNTSPATADDAQVIYDSVAGISDYRTERLII